MGRSFIAFSFHQKSRRGYLTYDFVGGAIVALHWFLLSSLSMGIYSVFNCFITMACFYVQAGAKYTYILYALLVGFCVSIPLVSHTALEISIGLIFVFTGFAKTFKSNKVIFLLQIPTGILLAIQAIYSKSYSSLIFLLIALWGIVKAALQPDDKNSDQNKLTS